MATKVLDPPLGTAKTLAQKARAYARAKGEALACKKRAELLGARAATLETTFLEQCAEEGVKALRVKVDEITIHEEDDGAISETRHSRQHTVAHAQRIFARRKEGVTGPDVAAAFRQSKLYADMVGESVNGSRLNAFVKEIEDDPERELPPTIAAVIEALYLPYVSLTRA